MKKVITKLKAKNERLRLSKDDDEGEEKFRVRLSSHLILFEPVPRPMLSAVLLLFSDAVMPILEDLPVLLKLGGLLLLKPVS